MNDLTPMAQSQLDHAPMQSIDPMLRMMEVALQNPELTDDRLSKLMDMRERQMDREAKQVFNRDFAAAMAEMPDVPKSGKNTHSGQRYSTLDDLIRTTRPVLTRHGLSMNWTTVSEGNEYKVTAVVRHAMGHSIQTTLNGQRDSGKQMNQLQGGGSTETYLKRYTGFSILGLSSGDEVEDDGRGSVQAPATITAEQFQELRGLIELAGISEAVLCTSAKIETLHELPADTFESAVKKLRVTIANKAKQMEET